MHDLKSPVMLELAHLVWLMADPYRQAWAPYCWAKALELSEQPGLGNLPQMLTEVMRNKATCTTSTDAP